MCLTGTFALWLVLPEFELHKGETYPALALVIISRHAVGPGMGDIATSPPPRPFVCPSRLVFAL